MEDTAKQPWFFATQGFRQLLPVNEIELQRMPLAICCFPPEAQGAPGILGQDNSCVNYARLPNSLQPSSTPVLVLSLLPEHTHFQMPSLPQECWLTRKQPSSDHWGNDTEGKIFMCQSKFLWTHYFKKEEESRVIKLEETLEKMWRWERENWGKENTYRKEQESKQTAEMYNWKQMFCQKPGAWLQAELNYACTQSLRRKRHSWMKQILLSDLKNKDWNTHWSSHIPFLLWSFICLFWMSVLSSLSHEFSEKEGKPNALQGKLS